MNAVVDNDIVIKSSCYGLADVLFDSTTHRIDGMGVLGSAIFVARRTISRLSLSGSTTDAIDRAHAFLARAITIEPTVREQVLAAEFELVAQRRNIALHTGESQLCAVVLSRSVPFLLTGDKRAIAAIENLLDEDQRLLGLEHKIKCLEQLAVTALGIGHSCRLKSSVCEEPSVDRVLSICFGCRAGINDEGTFMECLQQHIADLRCRARRVLAL